LPPNEKRVPNPDFLRPFIGESFASNDPSFALLAEKNVYDPLDKDMLAKL